MYVSQLTAGIFQDMLTNFPTLDLITELKIPMYYIWLEASTTSAALEAWFVYYLWAFLLGLDSWFCVLVLFCMDIHFFHSNIGIIDYF